MDPRFSSAVLLILSCWFWSAECREPNKILRVTNGERFGEWGKMVICPKGYAKGFAVKVLAPQGLRRDDTALNGIRLYCSGDEVARSLTEGYDVVESLSAAHGTWGEIQTCSNGYLTSFALRVEEYQGALDDSAVNNIKFTCEDGKVLRGDSKSRFGEYGNWSEPCDVGAICGIKTKVEAASKIKLDTTGLNDARFACCD